MTITPEDLDTTKPLNPQNALRQLVNLAQERKQQEEQERIERAREAESLRGIKAGLRLPIMQKTGSNPFTMGGDTVTPQGQIQRCPEGYRWALRHMVITGLTSGATPDRIQITRNGTVIWELNGNVYAQTWGRGELWVNAGETLGYQSVAGVTFNSTAQIQVIGAVDEYPAAKSGMAVD
jgi:hypothetical protein